MDYKAFLKSKSQIEDGGGFNPLFTPSWLYDFQGSLLDWGLRKGRAGVFADCGLGKTPMQLVWAENVIRHTNKPVLVLTPPAVGQQTAREAEKFDIEAKVSRDGTVHRNITITNYQQLSKFNPDDFAGVVCDESSILKNCDGATKATVTEFMRMRPYRLLCTATAAPNDFVELGTSSEALGAMGYRDMLTMFFKQETKQDYLGWGRTKYRMKGHVEIAFWRWICSWARACRKPSDLGFDDGKFMLPPLNIEEKVIDCNKLRPGYCFPVEAVTLEEQRIERRMTIKERCEAVAALADHDDFCVAWCHLNDEADLLERLIPGALQVSGSMSDEEKEEVLLAFSSGQLKKLITKPVLGCWGLNWQHCNHTIAFSSHSFEQWYQLLRRFWRFGQQRIVRANVVTTKGEQRVMKNLQRKSDAADEMFTRLVATMNDALKIDRDLKFRKQEKFPAWL